MAVSVTGVPENTVIMGPCHQSHKPLSEASAIRNVRRVVCAGPVVGPVVVVLPVARAMMGAMGSLGRPDPNPVGCVLLGKAVQVSANGLPETSRVSEALLSSVMVMPVDVAVKGPTVAAGDGRSSGRPPLGIELGIGTLKLKGPSVMLAGVAPVASTFVVAVPLMAVLPKAAAAETRDAGIETTVW